MFQYNDRRQEVANTLPLIAHHRSFVIIKLRTSTKKEKRTQRYIELTVTSYFNANGHFIVIYYID